ncbi:toll/interleukin-1 receptor domain-containing protein [candidate division KSB1 bacterium]|nr:toll/interleukin-1 receptor domain-containing protein [candidate division KSB1 bacterium]
MERFVDDLYEALHNEVLLLTGMDVFLDKTRLAGGEFYNVKLAKSLCQSICLIMIFTPQYFSTNHPYCAREYKAMELLEKARLKNINNNNLPTSGYIIPIILRRGTELPVEIITNRQYYNFSNFMLRDEPLKMHRDYDKIIRDIADYIYQRYLEFENAGTDPCEVCENFELPSEVSIKDWLETVKSTPAPFPGRKETL